MAEKSWRTRDIDSLPAFVEALAEQIQYLGTYGGKLPRSANQKRLDSNRGISQTADGDCFTRHYTGVFKGSTVHPLLTPTVPVRVKSIYSIGQLSGSNTYIGILPTGATSFTGNFSPTPIDPPNTGAVLSTDKIISWNLNIALVGQNAGWIYLPTGPGALISVGEMLAFYFNIPIGNVAAFPVNIEYEYE
jgi:hypothetical protein